MSDVIRDACSKFVETLKEHRRQLLKEVFEASDEISNYRDSLDGNSDWRFFEYLRWDERENWTLGEWATLDDESAEHVVPEKILAFMDCLSTKRIRNAVDRVFSSLESGLPSQMVNAAKREIEWKPELYTVVSDAVRSALDPDGQQMAKGSGDHLFEYRAQSLREAEFWPMLISEMSAEIAVRLDSLVDQSWIALVPMEQAFASFGELTDLPLFPFKLLNVVDEPGEDGMTTVEVSDERRHEQFEEEQSGETGEEDGENDRFVAKFVAALRRNNCVQVMESGEVDDSYANLASQLREKTNGLIPGHPLLVVPCSNGSASDGARFLRRELSKWMHFLSFCQLVFDFQAPPPASTSATASKKKRRSLESFLQSFTRQHRADEIGSLLSCSEAESADLEHGTGSLGLPELGHTQSVTIGIAPVLQEVPYIALAMKQETGGQARLWNILARTDEKNPFANIREIGWQLQNLPRRFETIEDRTYDEENFIKVWNRHVVPVLQLKQPHCSTLVDKDLINAIESAISCVARCRHRDPGELRLNAIIATETLLNPYDNQRPYGNKEGRERNSTRFAQFGSELSSFSRDELHELYKARNHIVHRSRLYDEWDDVLTSRTLAFVLFLECLEKVTNWARIRIHKTQQCDENAFEKFYEQLCPRSENRGR